MHTVIKTVQAQTVVRMAALHKHGKDGPTTIWNSMCAMLVAMLDWLSKLWRMANANMHVASVTKHVRLRRKRLYVGHFPTKTLWQ